MINSIKKWQQLAKDFPGVNLRIEPRHGGEWLAEWELHEAGLKRTSYSYCVSFEECVNWLINEMMTHREIK
jgi:hypothetical protein